MSDDTQSVDASQAPVAPTRDPILATAPVAPARHALPQRIPPGSDIIDVFHLKAGRRPITVELTDKTDPTRPAQIVGHVRVVYDPRAFNAGTVMPESNEDVLRTLLSTVKEWNLGWHGYRVELSREGLTGFDADGEDGTTVHVDGPDLATLGQIMAGIMADFTDPKWSNTEKS